MAVVGSVAVASSVVVRWLLPVVIAAAASWAGWWFFAHQTVTLDPRLPGSDRPAGMAVVARVNLMGSFTQGTGIPLVESEPHTWPGFRGSAGDNVARSNALGTTFPPTGPRKVWSLPLGFGYAGPAVAEGRVYILDYDQKRQADALRCLSLADGVEIWRRSYAVKVKFNHGMSRTVPAIGGGCVVTIGPKCHVLCVDARSGDFRWGIDLVRDVGTKEPPWYAGQCPLIDGNRVILAPAGPDVLLMAVDLGTGKPLWTTANTQGWSMTHSSVVKATLCGREQFIYCG
ncbi:MAG: PQQ-binding-like beta-propeller repeat protein, partial [Planctomycetota bacterium]